jgi:hypothetical protein
LTPMRMLESGIPLSLLLDLVMGPESADLLDHERPSAPDGRLVPGAHPRRQRAFRSIDPV